MSFYSYKNANAECSPGVVNGNILTGLNQRVCIQVKNVFLGASCLIRFYFHPSIIALTSAVLAIRSLWMASHATIMPSA